MHIDTTRGAATAQDADGAPMTGEFARSMDGARMLIVYGMLGALFGIVITKSEVISWFRIQEMFRFQSFHMYGIMASAVVVAFGGVQLMRKTDAAKIIFDYVIRNERTNEIICKGTTTQVFAAAGTHP